MKKILALVASISLAQIAFAQTPNANANTQWKINGNNASTTDFMGTTNNQSLVFKTNNITRATFDTQGKTIFDGGGEVIIHPGGMYRPISGSPVSAYMLKVGGSGHFDGELNSRQLFVQEYITYMKSLKGPRIDVDTIRMDSTRGIFGNTKIFGDVQIKQNLEVLGNAKFKGNITAEKGFTFDGINGISMTPATSTSPRVFTYGNSQVSKVLTICAAGPVQQTWGAHHFGGLLQIYDADPITGVYNANSGLLTFQTWSGRSSIDASIGGQTGGGGLLLNYFCGNNVSICQGANGGVVQMGNQVEIGVGIPATDNSVALNIKLNGTQDDGLQIMNSNNVVNFKVKNTGFVYAREVNVQIGPFPDYVFKKDYKLLPLEEVEKYIQVNKHLKGFESSDYYQINGLEIGEVVRMQQEKIEEMTLYLIELKKEINILKNASK